MQNRKEMKIGDNVKFLNEVGGGRIVGFQDKGKTALVEDADGFEIPMPVGELVVENGESYEGGTWNSPKPQAQTPPAKPAAPAAKPAAKPSPAPAERRGGEKLNVYLAFVPNKPDDMVETTFDAYIINDSNYFLTLTWLSAQGAAWKARFGGTLEPNTKEFVEEISRGQIDDIARVALQMIAYKRGKPFDLKPAISVEMRIDGTKFYKAGAFKASPFFAEPAIVVEAVRDDAPVRTLFADAARIREAMTGGHKTPEPARRPEAKGNVDVKSNGEVEVNLHDYALLDSTKGLSNADILNRQLQEVRDTMEKYKRDKGRRIVFIHGKGEGVLRAEVLRELKRHYPACSTQDASFQEYGFGATLVTIR